MYLKDSENKNKQKSNPADSQKLIVIIIIMNRSEISELEMMKAIQKIN